MKTNITKIILWIIIALLLWAIIFYPKQNECFDRLEVIQARLKELEQLKQDTQSQINQHEMDITSLKQVMEQLEYEESNLNSEALNLFNWFLQNTGDKVEEDKVWCAEAFEASAKMIRDWVSDAEYQWNIMKEEWWCSEIYKEDLYIIQEEQNGEWQPWQLTEDWTNQVMPPISGDDSHERFKSLSNAYGLNPSAIREVENHYGITEGVILCITIAETSGWKFGAGEWNIWNVWNTDSNPRGNSYSNLWASLDAIGRTLTNRYLWKKQTLGCLSNRHHCEEVNDNWARYATSSPETSGAREPNMVACLSQIYGTVDPSTFSIRRS